MSEMSPDFFVRLESHMAKEEETKREAAAKFAQGDQRMLMIEGHIAQISERLSPLDAFLKMAKVITGLAIAIMTVFSWIMIEKNADIKAMQGTLMAHTVQIGETIAMLKEARRDQDRIERQVEGKR